MQSYPDGPTARDRFITGLRPSRPVHDVWRAHAIVVEEERSDTGVVEKVATVFLTGRECPWHCVMCDLWQYTTEADTPAGAIATQVTTATAELAQTHPDVARIKLYNAGSFFDPRAVAPGDYEAVAAATEGFQQVIVESHPSLVGARTAEFLGTLNRHRDHARPQNRILEVAMGLETANPSALDRLNKRMNVDDFRRAADRLATMGAALRVFLLVKPPFVAEAEQDEWLVRSIEVAAECGASVVSLIPTRHSNGAMDALRTTGDFTPPHLADLERGLELAMDLTNQRGMRIFADLWDLDRFASCVHCLPARRERIRTMNREQRVLPPPGCAVCDGGPRQ